MFLTHVVKVGTERVWNNRILLDTFEVESKMHRSYGKVFCCPRYTTHSRICLKQWNPYTKGVYSCWNEKVAGKEMSFPKHNGVKDLVQTRKSIWYCTPLISKWEKVTRNKYFHGDVTPSFIWEHIDIQWYPVYIEPEMDKCSDEELLVPRCGVAAEPNRNAPFSLHAV